MAGVLATVHPRVCGEQSPYPYPLILFSGSSPRVRGTGRSGRRSWRSRPVHPRVCGEQRLSIRWILSGPGSSPRVRGTEIGSRNVPPRRRFIPACAGNRAAVTAAAVTAAVHPRVCGEQPPWLAIHKVVCGSSPRVRGTESSRLVWPGSTRFIPACAGNRTRWLESESLQAVHPRVCGEQFIAQYSAYPIGRFIPACAGNRMLFASRSSR